MFSQSAEYYDALYSTIKDYRAEAEKVTTILRAYCPEAKVLLDAACGPGEHARILTQNHGFEVDGFDLEPAFVEIAAKKCPSGRFWRDDLSSFRAQRSYDAVLCLFSSIGYLTDLKDMESSFASMAACLKPGGVILLEPWFEPSQWNPGRVSCLVADTEAGKVSRMSVSFPAEDRISPVLFDYLIGTSEGIQHRSERHDLRLSTQPEMMSCFQNAGLKVNFEGEGLFGRGIYIARQA